MRNEDLPKINKIIKDLDYIVNISDPTLEDAEALADSYKRLLHLVGSAMRCIDILVNEENLVCRSRTQ